MERVGSLLLASNLDRLHSLQRKHARLRALGVRCELLAPAQLARVAPYLRIDDDLKGALLLPDDCVIRQPLLFTRLLTELAQDKGAPHSPLSAFSTFSTTSSSSSSCPKCSHFSTSFNSSICTLHSSLILRTSHIPVVGTVQNCCTLYKCTV